MQSRRTFIRNLALAIPAYSFAGVLLSSCGTNEKQLKKSKLKIGVIGAGISGLHAAWLLQNEYGYEVEILEASDKIGGRIQSVHDIFGMGSAELGANEIYGQNHDWYKAVQAQAITKPVSNNSNFFSEGVGYSQADMAQNSDYQSMESRLEQMSQTVGSDISVETYMNQVQVPQKVQFIFKSKSEQMLGTSIDRASILYNSSEGLGKIIETKYKSGISFDEVILRKYQSILPNVLNNTQVTEIDYSGDKVRVTDHLQVTRVYDQIIVTVPLSVLKLTSSQAYGIKFHPSLPESKLRAMDGLGMDSGVRIIVQTNKSFWNNESESLFVNGKIGKYDIVKSDIQNNRYLLAATVHGENADILNNMSESEILRLIQAEWKEQIGEEASKSILKHQVVYWGKTPFIQGSFSYHKVGGSNNSRAELAKTIENKVFFAGEACNTSNNSGTIHGAIETAIETVKSIHRLQS